MSARTWFITGAASGFGYHLTTQLLTRGDRVIATDLRPDPLAVLSRTHRCGRFQRRLWRARGG
jgi:NAD(P)-dependent dehydrogenase (short-subunit alcohol dehydrogenase family)